MHHSISHREANNMLKTNHVSHPIRSSWNGQDKVSEISAGPQPEWQIADGVCALCDSERHLAHIVLVGDRWFVFDATHTGETEAGFFFVGSYAEREAAMDAAERKIGCSGHVAHAGPFWVA
jgi:hypothetical protein